jgi:hypothetical protein
MHITHDAVSTCSDSYLYVPLHITHDADSTCVLNKFIIKRGTMTKMVRVPLFFDHGMTTDFSTFFKKPSNYPNSLIKMVLFAAVSSSPLDWCLS